jgi:hypothetical protein
MGAAACDHFCTRLEYRFSEAQIEAMLPDASFDDIRFSDKAPIWCAVGIKSPRCGDARGRYTSALRIRALMTSSSITVSTTMMICAAVSPY